MKPRYMISGNVNGVPSWLLNKNGNTWEPVGHHVEDLLLFESEAGAKAALADVLHGTDAENVAAAVFPCPASDVLASAFAAQVRADLVELKKHVTLDEIRAANAKDGTTNSCTSHDHLDANESFLQAYEKVMGREFDFDSDEDARLHDAAWGRAFHGRGDLVEEVKDERVVKITERQADFVRNALLEYMAKIRALGHLAKPIEDVAEEVRLTYNLFC